MGISHIDAQDPLNVTIYYMDGSRMTVTEDRYAREVAQIPPKQDEPVQIPAIRTSRCIHVNFTMVLATILVPVALYGLSGLLASAILALIWTMSIV